MDVERIILVRHGESMGNEAASAAENSGAQVIDVPYRDADAPLSATGEAQADALGTALRSWGVDEKTPVWTSPYRRASETALRSLAAAAAAQTVPVLDERLRDRELGVLDGLSSHGVTARFPGEAARRSKLGKFYYRPPGGESWADVVLRLRSFLSELDHGGAETVALFAHEAVIYLARFVLEGWDEERVLAAAIDEPAPNASITVLERNAKSEWTASLVGDVTHLLDSGVPTTMHRGRVEPRDRPEERVNEGGRDAVAH